MISERLKFSRFVNMFEKEDVIALFHSLRLEVLYMKKSLFSKLIDNLRDGNLTNYSEEDLLEIKIALNQLRKINFLLPEDYNEMKDLEKIKEALLNKINIRMMYLLLTDTCNLHCAYCFLETNTPSNYQKVSMSEMIVKQAIEFYARMIEYNESPINSGEEVIHLYGGEPLLNVRGIKVAINEINEFKKKRRLPSDLKIALVSNGTLINEEMAKFFRNNNVSVGISIDGPMLIHNKYRKYSNGKGSFENTLKGFRTLTKYKVKTGISCTITPALLNSLDLFLDFIKQLDNCDGVSFNILHSNFGIKVDEEYYKKAAIFVIRAFEDLRKLGIYEERMLRKITAFVNQQIVPYDCGAGGEQIAISPAGLVSICQDTLRTPEFIVTKVEDLDFNPIKNKIMREWSLRSPLNIPECLQCPALGICGGGCPINAKITNGSIWSIDKRICPHSLYTLEWIIWDVYSQIRKKIL